MRKTGKRKAIKVPLIAAARVRITQDEGKVSKRLKAKEPYTIVIEGTVESMGRALHGALTDEQERLAAIVTSFSRSGNVQWGVNIGGVLVSYRGKVLEIDLDKQ